MPIRQKSLNEFIRERAELAGVTLTDHGLALVREKWESSSARLDDLIAGLRNLAEPARVETASRLLAIRVTCWLCGGQSNQTCQCHNAPPGVKPKPCNMVCNERARKTTAR